MPDKNDETTAETTETTETTEHTTTDETSETASEGDEPEWKKEITKVQNETQSSIARLEHRVSDLIGKIAVHPQATEAEPVTVVVQESRRNHSENEPNGSVSGETTQTLTQENQTNQNNENNDQTQEPPVPRVGGVLSRRRR